MDKISGTLVLSSIALLGSLAGNLFGGWDSLFKILLTLVDIDYLSGFISSAIEGGLSSSIGFKGIAKKIYIFCLVAVAQMIDQLLGYQYFIRDWTILFYIANESLSIIENAHRVGLPIPPILKRTVKLMRNKIKD